MTLSRKTCGYCGLVFTGIGFSPGGSENAPHYCCTGCYLVQRIIGSREGGGIASWLLVRLGVGAFLSMNVMMISLVLYTNPASELGAGTVQGFRWAMVILSTPAMLILGGPFILGALRDVQRGHISTDALISTGSMAAFAVSTVDVIRHAGPVYFDTATMLLLIVTIGRLLEAAAKNRTSQSIKEMMDLTPAVAIVVRDGMEVNIPSSEVLKGDIILVRSGERIPTDGEIVSGECMVEESAFTGESRPRNCGPGDTVYGGSINCDGLIRFEATAVAANSLLAQIHGLVERAQQERAPIERLTERVSTIFVPVVWAVALAAAAYWWLLRGNIEQAGMSALAVLVVACPCALGLATPMATCLAIGKAARAGVLIRSGEILELLPRVSRMFFDKTGTLTISELSVAEIRTVPGVSEEDALAIAASLESGSTHSIAAAIVSEARSREITIAPATDLRSYPGRGISAAVVTSTGPSKASVGSLKFIREEQEVPDDLITRDDLTTTYVALNGNAVAAITLQDTVRIEAADVVAVLQEMDVELSVISGDLRSPVERVAAEVGIADTRAECTPQDKVDAVVNARRSSTGAVAMVGDGVNDAPALAEADIGIATGGGTDLARQASDVTLLGDDLSRIPWVLRLSRRTYSIIRQNLFWALFYNCAAVILAFLGYVHPLIAAVAMVISSFAVIANSMRILTMKEITGDERWVLEEPVRTIA